MSPKHFICLVIICAAAPLPGSSQQHEDYYTSVGVLGKLAELEHHLLHNLRDYVDQEVAKNQQIAEILGEFEAEHAKALNHSQEYFGNPINVFRTIKRSAVDLKDLRNYIRDDSNGECECVYRSNASLKRSLEGLALPDTSDFRGAVIGLDRLQVAYKLNSSELAEGKFYGAQHGRGLSASDAFHMAVGLFDTGNFERSLEWFTVALEKFSAQDTDGWEVLSKALILEQICAAALKSAKPHVARLYLRELLQVDRGNRYALQNKDLIEALYFDARNAPKYRLKSNVKAKPSLTDDLYATCRGERRPSPAEERPLRCMYVHNNMPFLKIAPFKVEQLSLDPMVVYFHEAIYESEIEQIHNATTELTRSQVRKPSFLHVRTSKNSWLDFQDHPFLIPLLDRIIHMTNLSSDTFEELQLANYGIGGHYGPHYDFAYDPDIEFGVESGNRIGTALFYLSDVEFGGATAFPALKLAVQPIRRSMVFWYNIHDSSVPDVRTKHAACPVLKGSKWILTQWIHERGQEFLRPCGLQRTPHSSQM